MKQLNCFFLMLVFQLSERLVVGQGSHDYCSEELSCRINETLVYKNSACGCPNKSEEVTKVCRMVPVVMKFRDEKLDTYVVNLHNQYRHGLASGNDTRMGHDGVTDMMALTYDEDLEYTAYCYSFLCDEEHDKCRTTPKFLHTTVGAGQNQYAWYNKQPCDHTTIDAALDAWYSEITKMPKDRTCITAFNGDNCNFHETGHFTQVVWAKTTHVGCAFLHYIKEFTTEPKLDKACNIFCNYGPAGNVNPDRMYTVGKPARDCNETDPIYTSLCVGPVPAYGEQDFDYSGATFAMQLNMLICGIVLAIACTVFVY